MNQRTNEKKKDKGKGKNFTFLDCTGQIKGEVFLCPAIKQWGKGEAKPSEY